jgi:hypothetical protein
MRSDVHGHPTHASNCPWKAPISVSACLLLEVLCLSCPGCLRRSPPDLSTCTRIEIEYRPNALEHVFGGEAPNLLSPEEREHLRSFKTCVVTDVDQIKAFARDVSLGRFDGRFPSPGRGKSIPLTLGPNMHFVCCRGAARVTSFSLSRWTMLTEGKKLFFRYPVNMSVVAAIDPPEIRPFRLRRGCASNLSMLYNESGAFRETAETYPDPATWCDTGVHAAQSRRAIENGVSRHMFNDAQIFGWFICPGANGPHSTRGPALKPGEASPPAGVGPPPRSDFALNPDCQPSSAADTVLLFESKPGWNQAGGPELFTFANHEPKGGCVLRKDGTVKFIRTEQELRQLRWK